jgi:hypothetical protein
MSAPDNRLWAPRTIAGAPFTDVRQLLRQDRGDGFTFNTAYRMFVGNVFSAEKSRRVRELLLEWSALSFISLAGSAWWRVTPQGAFLRDTPRGEIPIDRARELVRGLETHIHKMNADERSPWCVRRATLYGSVLRDVPRIGDINLALLLVQRSDGEDDRALLQAQQERFMFSSFLELEEHCLREPENPTFRNLVGEWKPPEKIPPELLALNEDDRTVLKQMSEGATLMSGSKTTTTAVLAPALVACSYMTTDRLVEMAAIEASPLRQGQFIITAGGLAALERGAFLRPQPRTRPEWRRVQGLSPVSDQKNAP